MAPTNAPNPAALAVASASVLGRFQGIEQFDKRSVDLSAPVTINYQPFNLTRPLESIVICLKMRIGVTVGAYAQVGAEAPQNILQNIRLEGQHATFGNLVPLSLSGATQFALGFQTQDRPGSQVYISKGGGALTLQTAPGVPAVGSFDGTVANHDVIAIWNIPVGPQMGIGASVKRWLNSFLYMPADWGDRLRLSLTFGDKSALGDPTGATVALTAFQSAAGLPEVSVHLNYSILGPFQNAGPQGIIIRNEQPFRNLTALATEQIVTQLQKRITSQILVKSGTLETTAQTAGVTTFESLSDLLLERTQIVVDNKKIRQPTINLAERARLNRMFSTVPIQGYQPLMFVDGQSPLLAFRGDGLPAGSLFNLVTDVVTAGANTLVTVMQEQSIGGPFPSLRQ